MSLELYNTLTRKKETFSHDFETPVLLYHCGPTVYHYAHIGNLRAFLFADVLRRALEMNDYDVKQIMNITDVGHLTSDADEGEDKLEKGARREGRTAQDIARFYTDAFFHDIHELNIKEALKYPRASEHIPEQIKLIENLEIKGVTYETSDGIYFDTEKFDGYEKLAGLDLSGQENTDRVSENLEKKHAADFALWKFSSKDENRAQEWDSPWGEENQKGFPGWHLECSAMAMKYLGETLDIHTGGIDHIPVHHTNERAQSITATGKEFSKFWMHGGFVNVPDGKMAKSSGNFLRLETLKENDISPLAYRYWTLTAHYRSTIEFTWEALVGAQKALGKLYTFIADIPDIGNTDEAYYQHFYTLINDDLGTPEAIALIWKLVKDDNLYDETKKATLLAFDEVLGLDLKNAQTHLTQTLTLKDLPEEIQELVTQREEARDAKNWEEADRLRDEIFSRGYEVKDQKGGSTFKKI